MKDEDPITTAGLAWAAFLVLMVILYFFTISLAGVQHG